MFKAFEFRLHPNRRQRELLLACLRESRNLYNEMLEQVKNHFRETGFFLFKYSLTTRFKGRGGDHVPATTVQALADRLDKALRRFIIGQKLDDPVGFSRFKTANRWHSIRLRQYGKGRDVFLDSGAKRLKIPKKLGGGIKIKQHRPLEGTPKTAHLILRSDEKWYVIIVCDLGEVPAVGVLDKPEIGLKVFLADSEGTTVPNPKRYRKSQRKLRRAQRKLCRRKKGSNRRKKTARGVARKHLKIARQRKDFLHKTAKNCADNYSSIFIENLNVSSMVRNRRLAKSILDASWSKFVDILEYKAESAGARVVKVTARHTTQKCSNCGELVPKSLSIRTHDCTSCGYAEDRDINAAKNILRAGMQPSEQNVVGYRKRAPRSRLLL